MNNKTYCLALDLGASSGRLIRGGFDGERIDIEEVHRFPNEPVIVNGIFYWDTFRLYHELKTGLKKAAAQGLPIKSIGIDTWGVDYGLLDKRGSIIGNPICYRDSRTDNTIEQVSRKIPLKRLYDKTGIQFMGFNTLFQLYDDYITRPEIVENADCMLFMPDLFNYLLSGVKANEYTIQSTGQVLDANNKTLITQEMSELGINPALFAGTVEPGTVLGTLTDGVSEETGMGRISVIAVACHDTASAVVATPFADKNSAFLSCGTWSLFGMELQKPLITEKSFEMNYTNEGGAENTIRFLKNIPGLWIIQQLRKHWNECNENVSFADMEREAGKHIGEGVFVDVNDAAFTAPLNMVDALKKHLAEKGEKPETIGGLAASVYNGLAREYAATVNGLSELTGTQISGINMIGGGIKDSLLCELTAKTTGKTVTAGPVEGSVLGNIIVQLKALGEISDVSEGREIIGKSFEKKIYADAKQKH